MKINKEIIIKAVMIILLIVVMSYQVKIVSMIYEREEMFNSDPLSYGARKYGIDSCECPVNLEKTIWFNKTLSKTIIRAKPNGMSEIKLNLSELNFTE